MTANPQLQDDARPSREEVRAYLAHLLGASAFPASARRRRLLEYVVEQTLAGRAERLKAFDLAIAVLGRDKRFDPQNNPIVRIEVRRLRRDLEHYYPTDGRDDPIRITIPKGHYVPAFEMRGPTAGVRGCRAVPPLAAPWPRLPRLAVRRRPGRRRR